MKIHLLLSRRQGKKEPFLRENYGKLCMRREKKGRGEKIEWRSGGSQKGGRSRKYFFLSTRGWAARYRVCKTVKKKSLCTVFHALIFKWFRWDGKKWRKKLFFTSSPFWYGRKEPFRCAKLLTPLLCSTFFCQTWGHGMEIIVLLHCRKFSFTSSMWACSEHTAMWIDKIFGFKDLKCNFLFVKFLFCLPPISPTHFFPEKGRGRKKKETLNPSRRRGLSAKSTTTVSLLKMGKFQLSK